jgi:hypothetical protein
MYVYTYIHTHTHTHTHTHVLTNIAYLTIYIYIYIPRMEEGRIKVTREVYVSDKPWNPTSSCADRVSPRTRPSLPSPSPGAAASQFLTALWPTGTSGSGGGKRRRIFAARHHGTNSEYSSIPRTTSKTWRRAQRTGSMRRCHAQTPAGEWTRKRGV